MPKFQNLMESNDVGGIFVGRGMSRAFQQDKERKKQTSDELVMDKTVKRAWLKCQGPDVRLTLTLLRLKSCFGRN